MDAGKILVKVMVCVFVCVRIIASHQLPWIMYHEFIVFGVTVVSLCRRTIEIRLGG